MADARILVVVDGIFNLTTEYPARTTDAFWGPDFWFTISHFISTLRNSTSPTFTVDTASRGFATVPPDNLAAQFSTMTNMTTDPAATVHGRDANQNPIPFRFDDPNVDLMRYDVLWLFGFEGYDGGILAGPGNVIAPSELLAITQFMDAGGGVFAVGDHDGLGSHMCGFIPRVRYMRMWFMKNDPTGGLPPHWQFNWPGGTQDRADTLVRGATKAGMPDVLFFDDQSDDIPQVLKPKITTHPAIQGTDGPLTVYPDHMHEGEVWAPPLPTPGQPSVVLSATSANDNTLAFAPLNFVEFPLIAQYQECPQILATCATGAHKIDVAEPGASACENNNFHADNSTSIAKTIAAVCAYDGVQAGVGRVVTDSSFHHFIDLNLIGDPCSGTAIKKAGFTGSPAGLAVLSQLDAYYRNLAAWLARVAFTPLFCSDTGIGGYDLLSKEDQCFAYDFDSSGKQDHLIFYRPGAGALFIFKNRTNNAAGNFSPVFSSADAKGTFHGIDGYDLLSTEDRAFAFDFDGTGKLDHIVLYRPGSGVLFILKNTGGVFTAVFSTSNGLGGFDLKSKHDRVFAFDFRRTGNQDHLVLYRPGAGVLFILGKTGGTFAAVFSTFHGLGEYDLKSTRDQIFAFDFDHSGFLDHLVLYRPGDGVLFVLTNNKGTFTIAFVSGDPSKGKYDGVGGFDLKSVDDRAFGFDFEGSGNLDHLVLYRPGAGALFILSNVGGNFSPVLITGNPANGDYNGLAGYDLRSKNDQVMAFDYYGTGRQEHLILYRPGAGKINMLLGHAAAL
jgi:hypothetical protein